MGSISLRRSITKTHQKRPARKTAQISNGMMLALEERAAQEAIPLATLVRKAISHFLDLVESDRVPELNIDIEATVRVGRRGPAPQWTRNISYVLDRAVAEQFESAANKRGEKLSETARTALWLELIRPIAPPREMRDVGYGFLTKPGQTSIDTTETELLRTLRDIRADSESS